MEKELSCSNYGLMMEMSTEQLTNGYFHTNWDNQNDQNDPFESALSSMVSSPTTTTTPPSNGGGGDGIMIRELIGRLGSICDSSGEVTGYNSCSTNTSCYSTPLNSPPPSKFNLSSLMIMNNNNHNHNLNHNYPTNLGSINADPGFVERAAKFSCFGSAAAANLNSNIINNININNNNNVGRSSAASNKVESGKLSKVNSEKKMVNNNNNNDGGCDSREGSSVSEQNPGVEFPVKLHNDANSRKRKSIPKAKLKDSSSIKDDKVEVENEESDAKRGKVENEEKNKKENAEELMNSSRKEKDTNNINDSSNNNNGSNKDAQKPEPFKDYIHVRARRGQATDSHSLAERVRREKISERMKFLQDLVPGCNKVTGKATVLDEIINYVQSLQRQVEFLSMKLSTVNPRMEFNMEALLSNSKDMFQSRGSSLSQTMYPLDQNSAQAFPFAYQSTQQMQLPMPNGVPNGTENPFSVNPMNSTGLQRNPGIPLAIDGLADSMTQLPTFWEDDLQSLVQMGIVPNQTQSVPGTLPNAQMKVEL